MKKVMDKYKNPQQEGLIVNDDGGLNTGIIVYPYTNPGDSSIILRKYIKDLDITLFYTVSINENIGITDILSIPQVQLETENQNITGSNKLFGIPRENILANAGTEYPKSFQSIIQIYEPSNLIILNTEIENFEYQLDLVITTS